MSLILDPIEEMLRTLPAWSWVLWVGTLAAALAWHHVPWVSTVRSDRVRTALWELQATTGLPRTEHNPTPDLYAIHREYEARNGATPLATVAGTLARLVDRGEVCTIETVPQSGREYVPITYTLPRRGL